MTRVLRSDPTRVPADALLRSVGADLEACTPLDRTIGSAAGEAVLERLRASGEVPVGGALVTPGGELGVPLLIHVVLRSADGAISATNVRHAFQNGLRQAGEWEVDTLAVPPLGIGAGNLDAEASARLMCEVLEAHLARAPFPRDVVVVVADAYQEEAFRSETERLGEAVSATTSRVRERP